jgi:hypothetical protein
MDIDKTTLLNNKEYTWADVKVFLGDKVIDVTPMEITVTHKQIRQLKSVTKGLGGTLKKIRLPRKLKKKLNKTKAKQA